MNRPKPVTIKDIARVAGVSTAAVSQALRPRESSNIKLQENTIERVRLVANQLNYRPHVGARSIRSKHFGTIGYFSAKEGLHTYTPDGYEVGVHDVAEERDYRVTMIRIPHRLEDMKYEFPQVFAENNLDALVIESYNDLAYKIHEMIKETSLPVVYLNDRHEENSVYVDDVWASSEMTNHLIARGYKKICFLQRQILNGPGIENMHHSAQDRTHGYERAMSNAGLEAHVVLIKSASTVGLDVDLHDEDWANLKHFEAVVVYDDDVANMVGRYCLKHGIKIPDDLAIGSFNGDVAAMSSWMRLTTMSIPSYEMGRAASKLAFELLDNPSNKSIPSVVFKPTIFVGETS